MLRAANGSAETGDVQRRHRRREQWAALATQWEQSSLGRVRKCRRVPHEQVVQIGRAADGRSGVAGVVTCGSVWACPCCSSSIWRRRADELDAAVSEWDRRGGTVAMVTLTMRHSRDDDLEVLWDGLAAAWASATGNNRTVRAAKEAAGCAGWARVVEGTHGWANGWHLHVHALVFLDRPDRAQDLGRVMFDAWRSRLVTAGLQAPIAEQGGLDVRVMDLAENAAEVSRYVAKATYEATTAVALELAGSAGKSARRGNRRPWDVLASMVDGTATDRDRALWAEWERCSFRRRAIGWSRDIRKLLGLTAELTDDELAEDLDGDAQPVGLIAKPDWAELARIPHAIARLLDAAEEGTVEQAQQRFAADLGALLGHPPRDYANNCGSVPSEEDAPRPMRVVVDHQRDESHDVCAVTGEILRTVRRTRGAPSVIKRHLDRLQAEVDERLRATAAMPALAGLFPPGMASSRL